MSGGGGDSGADDIREQEEERQKQAQEAIEKVNNIFKQFDHERKVVNPVAGMSRGEYLQYVQNALAGNVESVKNYNWTGRIGASDNAGWDERRRRVYTGTTYNLNDEAEDKLRAIGLTSAQIGAGSAGAYLDFYDQAVNSPGAYQWVKSDNSIYDQYRQDYLDYQQPLLKQQYQDAQESVQFDLARRGATESTAGQQRLADLLEQYNNQQTSLQSRATQAANQYRSSVEQQRQALISQAQAGMAPTDAANLASDAFNSLQSQTPEYDALGDVFSQFADIYGLNLRAQGAGLGNTNQSSGGAAGLPGQTGTAKIRS